VTPTRADTKKLALPALICLALLVLGGGLIWFASGAKKAAQQQLASARIERQQNSERLARIAEE
jgi:hypothetical protein